MFEQTKSRLRDWADSMDERLTGTSRPTNERMSDAQLSQILGSPAAQSSVEFGRELSELPAIIKE